MQSTTRHAEPWPTFLWNGVEYDSEFPRLVHDSLAKKLHANSRLETLTFYEQGVREEQRNGPLCAQCHHGAGKHTDAGGCDTQVRQRNRAGVPWVVTCPCTLSRTTLLQRAKTTAARRSA